MRILFSIFTTLVLCGCFGQQPDRNVGGRCEGCEALLEYGDEPLSAQDTLPYFNKTNNKLILQGVVYHLDGQTPAENIIVYAYHTDEEGIYITSDESKGWEKRHGFLRGWTITGEDGRYAFYTNRPASYPDSSNPQHIHLTVKEPGLIPYYIDAIHFLDDPLLTSTIQDKMKNRGGSGLVEPSESSGIQIVDRDIILGKNIPDYIE